MAHGELAFCLQAHGGTVVYRRMEDKNERQKKKGKVRWESGGGEVKRKGGRYVGDGKKKKKKKGKKKEMRRCCTWVVEKNK